MQRSLSAHWGYKVAPIPDISGAIIALIKWPYKSVVEVVALLTLRSLWGSYNIIVLQTTYVIYIY